MVTPQTVAPLFTSTVTFQKAISVNGDGEPNWGDPTRIELQMDPQEIDDGIDNDGDGVHR